MVSLKMNVENYIKFAKISTCKKLNWKNGKI